METHSSMYFPTDTEVRVLTRCFLKGWKRLSRSGL